MGKHKLGVFLGSFDPIHKGHVSIIENVLKSNLVDFILIVPTYKNPWKKNPPASFDVRCQMIDEAIEDFNKSSHVVSTFRIEEIIHKDNTPSYSYITLNEIRKIFGKSYDEFYIICGKDVADNISKWKNYDSDISDYWKLIVQDRTENSYSSTMVRNAVSNGEDIEKYVGKEIAKIIKENKLYGQNSNN